MKTDASFYSMRDGGSCLQITDPATPIPWENILYTADGKYTMRMSQRGKGKTMYNYGANHVSDGKNFCLKAAGSPDIWSLNGGEAKHKPTSYCCDFYPGRIVFHTEHESIRSTLTVAVDPDSYLEVYSLTLENRSSESMHLQLTACDFIQLEGADNTQQLEETRFDQATGAMLCQRLHSRTAANKYASFFSASLQPDSWCGSMLDFLGRDCSFADAVVWDQDDLPNVNAYSFQTLLALRYTIELAPSENKQIYFAAGLADDITEAGKNSHITHQENNLENILKANKSYFADLTANHDLQCPDSNINTMYNVWNRIQLHWQNSCARISRSHNWRNNLQDSMGWMIADPAFARQRLTEVCTLAKADGFMQRTTAKLLGGETNNQRHTDIATWAVLCAARYAKETGDLAFFNQTVSYASGKKQATVAECLVNGMKWLLAHRGRHGMILFLDGDWSDPLEEAGKRGIGESPWTSAALVNAIKEFAPVLKRLEMTGIAQELLSEAQALKEAVNAHAWDGNWYIRGITDDGIRFCTKDDPDANVSLMMQAWCIISKIVPAERLDSVIEALDHNCKSGMGPILYGPPFLKERPELGRESVKRPGTGENGSCYTHAAMMLTWAETVLKRPDEALKIIQQVVPLRVGNGIDITLGCPLWWPNFYQGPHAAFPGRSSNIISSGAPAWFMMNISEGLLGIIPTLDGLKVAPNLPTKWDKVSFTRTWRGSQYQFKFTRNNHNQYTVTMDGEPVANNFIPPQPGGKTYHVMVT